MGAHEQQSRTDEWYTPKWVFEAMPFRFDLDPADAKGGTHSPAKHRFTIDDDGLSQDWFGFVWLNPPFGRRNEVRPWLERMVKHDNGIALLPNRTACEWWQYAASNASLLLFHAGKIRFERAGEAMPSPGFGNVFMSFGELGRFYLDRSKLQGLKLTR